jgi:hypothetical protein
LAAGSGGRLLRPEKESDKIDTVKTLWPEFPGGQLRETRFRSMPLTPAWLAVLGIALLLCALWALRKRFQLD